MKWYAGASMGSRMSHFGTPWALAIAHESPSRALSAHKLWARAGALDLLVARCTPALTPVEAGVSGGAS